MKNILLPLILTTALASASPSGWTMETTGSWRVAGKIKSKKDVSAIDLFSGSKGLLASDEGSSVQSVKLDPAALTLTIGASWSLLESKSEADFEGMAAAPAEHCYYVTGSHAISRKKQVMESSRYHIFRVQANPATGEPSGISDTASLRPILEAQPELKPFLDEPAMANGIDIEGLAWRDGRLFVGFRAPCHGGTALILEVGAKAVFDGGEPDTKLHALPVSRGTGIRSLTAVQEGFLFLGGDSGQDQATTLPGLYFWKSGALPQKLGSLPAGKPEALTVLSENETEIHLLIISDGLPNGNPTGVVVRKTPQGSNSAANATGS